MMDNAAQIENVRSAAQSAMDRARSMDSLLRNEVHGGSWNDEVGYSYLSYTENLCRMLEKVVAATESLANMGRAIEAIDEYADRERVEKMKEAVKANGK